MSSTADSANGEMLLAVFKYKYSLTYLQEDNWYHIPVERAPKTFRSAKWLCFYQGKAFGQEAYRVQYYGEIEGYDIVPYRELFPNRMDSAKSDWLYYKIRLKELKRRPEPILSFRPRRLTFVPTTLEKFESAQQINDLFNDSPLEDLMWHQLKKLEIKAERQWLLPVEDHNYYLDFAVFCNGGFIDIETDGDFWHAQKDRIKTDNERNNQLAQKGWRVLRYNGDQLRSDMGYCVSEVQKTIATLAGLSDDGLVPRVFLKDGAQVVQQLSLFESGAEYKLKNAKFDSGAAENLEV
jgi:very-short-patch-repair endonuclease